MTPNDRKYTKEHEWILTEGNIATVGITDHAQDALGDIVFVELPQPGDSFTAGDSFAVVESVKAVSNIYLAMDGTVTEVNDALADQPELINESPYEAFIAKFEIDPDSLEDTLTADEYEAFVASEEA